MYDYCILYALDLCMGGVYQGLHGGYTSTLLDTAST